MVLEHDHITKPIDTATLVKECLVVGETHAILLDDGESGEQFVVSGAKKHCRDGVRPIDDAGEIQFTIRMIHHSEWKSESFVTVAQRSKS